MKFSVIPVEAFEGGEFTVVVDLENPTSTDNVTIAIGTNPSGGVLSGPLTVAAVNGVAFFNDLEINELGDGYTLVATAPQQPNAGQYNYPPCGTLYSHNSVSDAAEHANLNPATTESITSNPFNVLQGR